MSNSQNLQKIIIKQINLSPHQRITFADYMNLVLYHPDYGYYSSGKVQIGSQGDFFTSSSLGSDFGELLAEQFVEMWKILGFPQPFTLVEVGAGLGVLAKDILNYLKNNYSQFYQNLNYFIVETSPGLIERQKILLIPYLNEEVKLAWKSWQDISEKSIIGCSFSNELIDAFPVHQLILQKGQLKEIYITQDGQQNLQEISNSLSTKELKDYFELVEIDIKSEVYPEGYRTEVNLAALGWLKTISSKLKRGYLLTIDYGYKAIKYYHPQRSQGTLQCYYQHHRHNNPYIYLGQQDITTHVNFTALEKGGELYGLKTLDFTQQGMFLMALGLGGRLANLSSGQYDFGSILYRRDALHQLIDPTGLGGFGVLIQCKGLSEIESQQVLKGLKFPD